MTTFCPRLILDRFLRGSCKAALAQFSSASLASTTAEKEGDSIGRYKLSQQIGEGGFGTVYLTEQTEPVKRKVALSQGYQGGDGF